MLMEFDPDRRRHRGVSEDRGRQRNARSGRVITRGRLKDAATAVCYFVAGAAGVSRGPEDTRPPPPPHGALRPLSTISRETCTLNRLALFDDTDVAFVKRKSRARLR